MPIPYEAALDNWNRYTDVEPEAEPDPHLLLGAAVPGMPAAEAPLAPAAPAPAAGLAPTPEPPPIAAQGARKEAEEAYGAGGAGHPMAAAAYGAMSSADKLRAIGSGEVQPDEADIVNAAVKNNPLLGMDPRYPRKQLLAAAHADPKVMEAAGEIAAARKLEELGSKDPEAEARMKQGAAGELVAPQAAPAGGAAAARAPIGPASVGLPAFDVGMAVSGAQSMGGRARLIPGPKYEQYMGPSEGNIRTAQGALSKATTEASLIEARGKAQEALILAGGDAEADKVRRDSMAKQAALEGTVQTKEQEWQAAKKELEGMDIDSGRVLRNPFMALFALVGGAVGGVYGAMNGTHRNDFLKTLDTIVDRDIAQQKAAVAKKQGDVAGRFNVLGYFRQKLGDEKSAEHAARLYAYEKASHLVLRAAAQNGAEAAIANGKKAEAAIGEKISQQERIFAGDRYNAAWQEVNRAQGIENVNANLEGQIGAAKVTAAGKQLEHQPTGKEARELMEDVFRIDSNDPKAAVRVHGLGDKERAELRGSEKARPIMKRLLGEMKAIVSDVKLPWTEKRGRVKALMAHTAVTLKQLVPNMGTFDAGVERINEAMVGDNPLFITSEAEGAIQQSMEEMNALDDQIFDNHIVTQVDLGFGTSKSGKRELEARETGQLYQRRPGSATPQRDATEVAPPTEARPKRK